MKKQSDIYFDKYLKYQKILNERGLPLRLSRLSQTYYLMHCKAQHTEQPL